jgi:predicted PolB exonuclease-like 3'-5' exonuclease
MNINASLSRRNVVLDIETVGLVADDPKAALSALAGRIVCVCLLIDDGQHIAESALISPDEKAIVSGFWAAVRPTDVFIGHNLFDFDLPMIRQRSWILGIRPSRRIDLRRFYSRDFIDTLQLWSNFGSQRYASLDQLAAAMGCEAKTAHGCDVAEWWAAGDLVQIAQYCSQDVRVTYQLFRRMMFQALPKRYLQLKPVNEAVKDNIIQFPEPKTERDSGIPPTP